MCENLIEKTLLMVPGSKIRVISKADIRYEGLLVNVVEEEEILVMDNVLWFGNTTEKSQSSMTAERMGCGHVTFRCSELKEVEVLDAANSRPNDPAVVIVPESCTADSRAVAFTNEVWTWVMRDEMEKVEFLVKNAHLHESFEAATKTLLHRAVQLCNEVMVRKLLLVGANINAQDSMGMTPLMLAMAEYKEYRELGWAIIKALLEGGADVLFLTDDRKSAVHMFCADYKGFYEIKEELFKNLRKKCPLSGESVDILVDAGFTLIQAYGLLKDRRTIELMIQRGSPVDHLDHERAPVIHLAIESEDIDTVELLLKYGASTDISDDVGNTPWSHTEYDGVCVLSRENEAKLVQLLLDHGASPTAHLPDGYFQGQVSLIDAQRDTIRLLVQNNLDFTATDVVGQCALHYLAWNHQPGVVEELKCCKTRMKVNVRDVEGATPLHSAVEWKNVEMLELLLSEGAEVNCQTIEGYTPLFYACANRNRDSFEEYERCVILLLQHYADPQLVVARSDGAQISVFELAIPAADLNAMKPLVAHMAILEGLGTPITEVIRAIITSKPALEEHLHECRRLLRREISGSVNLLKLLTAERKKMAKLLNNEDLVLILNNKYFQELRLSSVYYHDTLGKRYEDGARYKLLKVKAAVSAI